MWHRAAPRGVHVLTAMNSLPVHPFAFWQLKGCSPKSSFQDGSMGLSCCAGGVIGTQKFFIALKGSSRHSFSFLLCFVFHLNPVLQVKNNLVSLGKNLLASLESGHLCHRCCGSDWKEKPMWKERFLCAEVSMQKPRQQNSVWALSCSLGTSGQEEQWLWMAQCPAPQVRSESLNSMHFFEGKKKKKAEFLFNIQNNSINQQNDSKILHLLSEEEENTTEWFHRILDKGNSPLLFFQLLQAL